MTAHSLSGWPVPVSSLSAAPVLVTAGSVPVARPVRVDAAGYPACEHCCTRLNRAKKPLHTNPTGDEIGRICHYCYDIWTGKRAADAPAAAAAASTAMDESPDSGTNTQAAAVSTRGPQTLALQR